MSLIIDCQLFPCINYVQSLIKYKYVKIEKYENFQKMSFRNRYIISGANGIQSLTIPIVGGREQKTLITEVRINNSIGWKRSHWRSLSSAYSKAPFFEYYAPNLKNLIFSEEECLSSLNIEILRWICSVLNIKVVIEFTESYISQYEEETDYRNYFLPKSFQNSEYASPYYSQVFEDRIGFQPNLSVIDLILCEGPNSINVIT